MKVGFFIIKATEIASTCCTYCVLLRPQNVFYIEILQHEEDREVYLKADTTDFFNEVQFGCLAILDETSF